MKRILTKIIIAWIISFSINNVCENSNNSKIVEAKTTKTVTGTRIMNLKQKIDGKKYYIGCNIKKCNLHNGDVKYSEKPCSAGSDLNNVYVQKEGKNGKMYWKTLRELNFVSMQGGCISKDILMISFVDKGRNKKGDLTALVKIDIKNNEVVEVNMVKGASELNIDTLGHSNDFTYFDGKYYGAWYQENGKEDYSNKIGTIKEELEDIGKVAELKDKNGAAVFGIAVFDNANKIFAMGIRKSVEENGKQKLKRYIATYKANKKGKKIEYAQQGKLINLKKNNDYNVPQCMEIYNKKIYLIKYFHSGKKKTKNIKKIEKRVKYKNNIVEVYDFKGNLKKEYIIKNPTKTYYNKSFITRTGKVKNLKKDMLLKQYKWEIESLIHYKKNTFYYTMYKPSSKNIGKQAYLYKVNLK